MTFITYIGRFYKIVFRNVIATTYFTQRGSSPSTPLNNLHLVADRIVNLQRVRRSLVDSTEGSVC